MAEEILSLKRQREEVTTQTGESVDGEVEDVFKRQKSYKDIISILEEDEDEPNEDISSLITTLQQEISPSSSPSESSVSDNQRNSATTTTATTVTTEINSTSTLEHCNSSSSKDEDEEDGEKVMRHLLEASDDELGIPNNDVVSEERKFGKDELVVGEDLINGCDFGVGDGEIFDLGVGGMWEFEDETANYYAMLQSELFLGAAGV